MDGTIWGKMLSVLLSALFYFSGMESFHGLDFFAQNVERQDLVHVRVYVCFAG